ncbi:MAG TPA: DUF5711 family protein [Clostridia bacterium]|nr:DUF5711 family protein [Clostridia bacterium]
MKNKEITQEIELPVAYRAKKKSKKVNAKSSAKKKSGKKTKNKKGEKRNAVFKLSFLVFAILFIAFLSLNSFDSITLENVTGGFNGFFEQFQKGDGFPYQSDAGSFNNIDIMGNKLVVLKSDSSIVFNSTAKKLLTQQHTFTDPAIKVKNGRILLFDRGSGRFMIHTRSELLYEKTMSDDILTAEIGKRGNCAIATSSSSAASVLTVFDKNQQEVFVWRCSAEYISDISLSDNGKSVAIAVIGSKNAEIYSKIHIFNFDSNEPLASFDFKDTTLFNVTYLSNATITAQGDKRHIVIENRKTLKQDESLGTDYYTSFYEHESGKTTFARSDFGGGNNRIYTYNSRGKLLFEKEIDAIPKSISCDLDYTVILTEKKLIYINNNGVVVNELDLNYTGTKVVLKGGTVYVLGNAVIEQYRVDNKNSDNDNQS